MAFETVLVPTSFTSELTDYGYGYNPPGKYELTIGKSYTVIWDGTEYAVTAVDGSDLMPGAVFFGNVKNFFLEQDTGEPFLIGEFGGALLIICVDEDVPTTHNVTIYAQAEDTETQSFNIVLKDRDGADVVYPATVVRLKTEDGAVRKFVNEESIAVPVETSVDPDFSDGDMEIVPSAGNVFSKVMVTKPAELIPANIPEGMYIAGVGPGEYGATDEENEEALCMFASFGWAAGKVTVKNVGNQVATSNVYIPLDGKICLVQAHGSALTQTSTTNLNYPVVQPPPLVTNYTVVQEATRRRISWSYSYKFTGYGSLMSYMYVLFTVPGVKVKKIDGEMVFHCDSTVAALPANATFQNMSEITKAHLKGAAITTIAESAFKGAQSLKTIDFPDGLLSIGHYAFQDCTSLLVFNIPTGVTTIGSYSLRNCISLSEIVVPDGVTEIGSGAFYGCKLLSKAVVPNSVTTFGTNVFFNCNALSEVNLPDKITSIPVNTFNGCTALSQFTIPSGVTSIDVSAFYGCTALSQLTLPSGVVSIGSQAFYRCTALEVLDCSACTSVPTLASTNVFTSCPSTMQIKVPTALYDEWIAATNWSTHASKIVAV